MFFIFFIICIFCSDYILSLYTATMKKQKDILCYLCWDKWNHIMASLSSEVQKVIKGVREWGIVSLVKFSNEG